MNLILLEESDIQVCSAPSGGSKDGPSEGPSNWLDHLPDDSRHKPSGRPREKDCELPQVAVLRDHRLHHVRDVLRAKTGDTVRVGLLGNAIGDGTIVELDRDSVRIEFALHSSPPEKLPLTIVLALPRPKVLRRVFRSLTELGVSRIVVVNSYRVEKSFWQSPHLKPESIERFLREGLEQSRDTILPTVQLEPLFKPFVEDRLGDVVGKSQAIVAHPGSKSACERTDSPTTLAIGPEGGFIPYEIAKLKEAGFAPVHLGPRILRVETAVPFLVASLFSG